MLPLLLLLPLAWAALPPRYLSPSGSDAWDGTAPSHTEGTAGPWASLDHAVSELRKLRPGGSASEETRASLFLLAGTYYLDDTVWLDARDSFLDIAALNGASVTISGGQVLELPWTEEDGGVRTAALPATCAEVFLDSWRLLPARSPNADWGPNRFVANGPWHYVTDLLEETDTCSRDATAFSQSCPDSDKEGFVMDGELAADWPDLQDTQVVIFHSWVAEYAKVANITMVGGRQEIRFQEPLKHDPVGQWVKAGGWRFLILNNRAVLDQEGEVVCVQEGEQARVSYIPPADLADQAPVMAVLEVLLDFRDTTSVTLTDLNFRHTSSGGHDGPYNYGAQSAVRMVRVEDVIVEGCEFAHTGMIGIYIADSSRVQVQNSHFWDVAYHGVMLRKTSNNDKDMTDILIDNNVFGGCGISRYWQATCVWADGDRNITVSHNEISHVSNHPIRVTKARSRASNNGDFIFHIEFNHIHNYGSTVSSDYGGIYIGGGDVCGKGDVDQMHQHCYTHAHIYNNWIETGWVYENGPAGIYSDAAGCGTVFENNILRGEGNGALLHHCGLDNESKNNIVHRNGLKSFDHIWGGCEKHSTALQKYSNHHNIYLFDTVEEMTMFRRQDRYYNEAPTFHSNLYWSPEEGAEGREMFPGAWPGVAWAAWRDGGNDTDSLWIDPLFGNPGEGDYTLNPESPGWLLGITQVDTSSIGPRRKTDATVQKRN